MSESFLNARKLEMKFDKACKNIDLHMEKAVLSGLMPVQSAAKMLVPVQNGELRGSIRKRAKKTSYGAQGMVYTNKKYAPYVEFGTGPKGAENHQGISPNVNVAYTVEPWWIHEGSDENEVDRETAERYHWPYIDTAQGRFYKCSGQPAQPFMYPALKATEKEATKKIGKYIARKIREEMKK